MVKPFLLLSIRADDAAADDEYEAFLGFSGLGRRAGRVRLDQRALGGVDLRDWSGILLGGGPFDYTQPDELKSSVQRRVEADISGMLDAVVDADFPFLGACYGIGALGRHQGAMVDRHYSEPVGYVQVTLTRTAGAIRCWAGCRARSAPSPGTRRRSARCRATPRCWPAPPPARCRRSGSAPTSTRPSSTPNWT